MVGGGKDGRMEEGWEDEEIRGGRRGAYVRSKVPEVFK